MKKYSRTIENEILICLRYFHFFDYPPTFEELYIFLRKKTSKQHLVIILKKMVKKSLIKSSSELKVPNFKQLPVSSNREFNVKYLTSSTDNLHRYTLPEYPIHTQAFIKRQKISIQKITQIQPYVKILSLFPQIRLVGLSGSVAMLSAQKNHDVDLFIVTAKNRLWTGRIIALLLAQIMGKRRKFSESYKLKAKSFHNAVCLNLFFDESNLLIPKSKRSEYVAHELLQMKPFDFAQGKSFVQKDNIYQRLIDTNKWVFDIFPNASSKFKVQSSKLQLKTQSFSLLNSIFHFSLLIFNNLGWSIEQILKKLQLYFINRHKTTEIITATQLWFHPDDFEKKISENRSLLSVSR